MLNLTNTGMTRTQALGSRDGNRQLEVEESESSIVCSECSVHLFLMMVCLIL